MNSLNEINISGRTIGQKNPVFVIAEVGANYNGNKKTAMRMIEAAASAGVDCVKFQTYKADDFVSDKKEVYEYISRKRKVTESAYRMFKRLELPYSWHKDLFDFARKKGLIPMSTPMDVNSVDLLEKTGVGAYKVGSDDLTNLELLRYIAGKKKPVIISTGMSTRDEIKNAVICIKKKGNSNIILLHCVSLYPTPDENINLKRIQTLKDDFGPLVGFSDHTIGDIAAIGAVAMGAVVVEKHFTLSHSSSGPDHWFSANPRELKDMVISIRRLEKGLGQGDFDISKAENKVRLSARRSIVARRDIKKGEIISRKDLLLKRPGRGLSPEIISSLVGSRAKRDIPVNTLITMEMLLCAKKRT